MKVAIIGSGILGVTCAYFLNQHGIDVTVFEKESEPARGASYGNAGYLQADVPDPWNAPGAFMMLLKASLNSLTGKGDQSAFSAPIQALPGLTAWGLKFLSHSNKKTFLNHLIKNRNLAQYSSQVMAAINEAEQLSYCQSSSGSLIIFRDQAAMDRYAQTADYATAYGAQVQLLDRDALLQKEGSLNSARGNLVGAVYYPQDYAGNSRLFCNQMAAITQSKGVCYRFGTTAERIIAGNSGIKIRLKNNEDVIADAVVIAAGVHSRKIAATAGVGIAVAPAKGYSISVPIQGWTNPPKHIIADMAIHAGFNPLGDVLRVAGTAEFCSLNKTGISTARTRYMIQLVAENFPAFARTINPEHIDPWGGFRPLSADGLPFIGESHVSNVYLNTGHSGLGWTQGAGSSKALADLIAGMRPEIKIADYDAQRLI
jgi:D-amino-acid dehydrogenase